MGNKDVYDLAIIGGGISSCVFTSRHIKNGFLGKIAIIEAGRNLGGRASTRNSISQEGWQLNHGSPNINISNLSKNNSLEVFIQELIDENIISFDSSELIKLNSNNTNTIINTEFYCGKNYVSNTTMSDLSRKIIEIYNFRNQIDFYFNTLIFKLEFKENKWILTSKNGKELKAKFLICSSNLILHKRSLDILKISQIPLRKAIPINKDKTIDSLLSLTNKQNYIQRLTFLIYTNSNYKYRDNYQKKYRYILLDSQLEEEFKFERIIFQKNKNNKLGIVIHTRNNYLMNEYLESNNEYKFKKDLLLRFNKLFEKDPFINPLKNYSGISIMKWRASQPSGNAIPDNLQICKNYNIGFCGDWFVGDGFGRIEGAISSALRLSDKIIY